MIKRIFDIIASFLGLILLSPLLLIIALAIRINMGSPVFFLQQRSGRYGKPFTIIKFRTMIVNHGGSTVTVKGENRITPLGRFLREKKLDELPELWNVLTGDMSLVGPRPDVPEYTNRLSGMDRQILGLRPGITGPASLKYANEENLLSNADDPQKYNDEVLWPDKVKLNADYLKNRSFLGDLIIIFRTIFR